VDTAPSIEISIHRSYDPLRPSPPACDDPPAGARADTPGPEDPPPGPEPLALGPETAGFLASPDAAPSFRQATRRFERQFIAAALARHGGNITTTARELGIQRPNLHRKMRALGLTPGPRRIVPLSIRPTTPPEGGSGLAAAPGARDMCQDSRQPRPVTRLDVPPLRSFPESLVRRSAGPAASLDEVPGAVPLDGLPGHGAATETLGDAKTRFERDYIQATLEAHQGRVRDAAAALGIQRPNLYRKLRALRVSPSMCPRGPASDPGGVPRSSAAFRDDASGVIDVSNGRTSADGA
jgi:ActR/RegA family two-component response regulator